MTNKISRLNLIAPLLATAIAAGVGGCSHFPRLADLMKVKVRPVSTAELTPMGPFAAEDRLYAGAVRAIDQRRYGEALDALQVAREARPNDPRVLTAMAVVYDKLGRFDLSDRYYDQAEKADPGSRIVALDRRYSLFLRSNGKQGGVPGGTALAVAAPTPAKPAASRDLYAQAVEAIQHHEYGVALGVLRSAKDATPGDARVLTALGVTYDHLGRFDLSARYYDLAEQADPGSAVVAQDRRTSLALQQHGGVVQPDDVIVLAKAPATPAEPTTTVRVSQATTRQAGPG
jgi:Flp pilus assembly protein TadD